MATKSTSKAREEQGEAAVQPAEAEKTENSAANAQAAAEEEAHEEQTAAETQETSPDPEKDVEAGEAAISEPVVPEPAAPELESISQLANRHRVPGWQLAALLRFMGWNDDKMIRDGEFRQALEDLKNRRMGGGRR
ncbi:MAG TPA: hypothetical protein H9768_01740 [Candidatus Mailhella merdavium]|nr:hypothetical protein [Candidatus Mailhella merdavium]